MATYRLLGICCEHRASINLSDDLVSDDYSYTELISDALESSKELSEMHLTSRKFSSAAEVSSVESCSGVNDHQCESVFCHKSCGLEQKLVLLISVVSSSVSHVVKHLLFI